MKYTNIFEKLFIIFDLISKSWLSIIFIGFAIIFIIMLICKKLSKKVSFICIISACFGLLICNIYKYFEPLSIMMDTLIDNLFTHIYFPSAYSYLFILLFTDVVTIINLLNPKVAKVYKKIHGICFIIINFVLAFILEMIAKYNINIFSKKSIFANTDFITLLEFSMNIFIIWLISLLIAYLINIITERVIIAKEKNLIENTTPNVMIPEINITNNELKEEYNKVNDVIETPTKELDVVAFVPNTTNQFIPSFVNLNTELPNTYHFENNSFVKQPMINETLISQPTNYQTNLDTDNYSYQVKNENTFDLSSFIPKKQEVRPINDFNNQNTTNQIFEQILKNELPVVKQEIEENPVAQEKDTYTLNDYRIFNKMLKDIREHNESNSISIDKKLEYRLITKYSTETYHMFQKMLKIYSN